MSLHAILMPQALHLVANSTQNFKGFPFDPYFLNFAWKRNILYVKWLEIIHISKFSSEGQQNSSWELDNFETNGIQFLTHGLKFDVKSNGGQPFLDCVRSHDPN